MAKTYITEHSRQGVKPKPCCTPADVARVIETVRKSYLLESRRGGPGWGMDDG